MLPSNVVPPKPNLANNAVDTNATDIVDTGSTGHYFVPDAAPHCHDIQHTSTGPSVQVANGHNIKTTQRATIPLAKELSEQAKTGHIFDHLKSCSLISIGQLCNNDCVALFTKYHVNIFKNGQCIIGGQQNQSNGLWNIPLAPKERQEPPSIAPQAANGAISNT